MGAENASKEEPDEPANCIRRHLSRQSETKATVADEHPTRRRQERRIYESDRNIKRSNHSNPNNSTRADLSAERISCLIRETESSWARTVAATAYAATLARSNTTYAAEWTASEVAGADRQQCMGPNRAREWSITRKKVAIASIRKACFLKSKGNQQASGFRHAAATLDLERCLHATYEPHLPNERLTRWIQWQVRSLPAACVRQPASWADFK